AGFLAVDRQVDDEARPLTGFRIRKNEAARLLDDAIDRGKTEARTLADLLRREKRFKDLAQNVPRNAGPRISAGKGRVVGDRQDVRAELGHLVGLDRIR